MGPLSHAQSIITQICYTVYDSICGHRWFPVKKINERRQEYPCAMRWHQAHSHCSHGSLPRLSSMRDTGLTFLVPWVSLNELWMDIAFRLGSRIWVQPLFLSTVMNHKDDFNLLCNSFCLRFQTTAYRPQATSQYGLVLVTWCFWLRWQAGTAGDFPMAGLTLPFFSTCSY
jgi:hypothetical protein